MTTTGGRIDIAPYDPTWPVEFIVERDRLASALGDLAVRIDHHGSTAVPGLAAKPVIDIQVAVWSLQPLSAYSDVLARLGYTHLPHVDDAWCPYFRRPAQWPHTHHVHVVEAGGAPERRTLAFRDYLREHPAAAAEYADLKRDLAGRANAGELDDYASAKTAFVSAMTDAALAAGYPRRETATARALSLPVETPRLILRDFLDDDVAAVHAYASDRDVTRHMFYGPRDAADTRDYLARMIRSQRDRPRRAWELAVVDRPTNRLIGACDLTMGGDADADLGYVFARDAWHQGYATEAARALVDAGFRQLRLDWIYALCERGHVASGRVLEKAGLRHVRTIERYREARGRWWDMELFAVARRDWP